MARGRMINQRITRSQKFDATIRADEGAGLLYTLLIPFADRDGRLEGNASIIKSTCYPRWDEMPKKRVSNRLQRLHDEGLILWYEVDGEKYIQITAFTENQEGMRYEREKPSAIPPCPEGFTSETGGRTPATAGVNPEDDGNNPAKNRENSTKSALSGLEGDCGVTPATAGSTPAEIEREIEIEIKEEGMAVVAQGSATPSLYKAIEAAFLSRVEKFTNYQKEGQAIKGLISKAEKWSPDDPESFIFQVISMFFTLRQKDKFFGGQPFTPSALNSSGIFDRVMVQFENRKTTIDPEVEAYLKGVSA